MVFNLEILEAQCADLACRFLAGGGVGLGPRVMRVGASVKMDRAALPHLECFKRVKQIRNEGWAPRDQNIFMKGGARVTLAAFDKNHVTLN